MESKSQYHFIYHRYFDWLFQQKPPKEVPYHDEEEEDDDDDDDDDEGGDLSKYNLDDEVL